METSYGEKLVALARALATSPRDLPRYLAQLPVWRRRPVDLELPWFSYGAIRFLEKNLRPDSRVFEFGSGGSTLFFARRAAQVLAVENDAGWHRLVCERLRERGLAHAGCELHPLADDSLAAFQQSAFSQRIRSGAWDAAIVDCHLGFHAARHGVIRPAAFALAQQFVVPGGLIVLDDSWMFPELLRPAPGWEINDFSGVGPCRYGVTSTAIFRRTA